MESNPKQYETIPLMIRQKAKEFGEYAAQLSKDGKGDFQPTNYQTLYKEMKDTAAGLHSIGVSRGDHVGLIADNRKEWLLSDIGLLTLGAADVPRGCDSMPDEIGYILGFSECEVVIAENQAQAEKILSVKDSIPTLKKLIMMEHDFSEKDLKAKGIEILSFSELMEKGKLFNSENPDFAEGEIDKGAGDDLATIIFTSGTTGEPKGVMLSHRNFLHQVENVPQLLDVGPGDIWLCVLPVWHSFERIMQYVALGAASALAYSKPIGQIMLADFAKVRPTWMASVPRIWESVKAGVYRNIKKESAVKRGLFHFFVGVGGAHSYFSYRIRGLLPEFKRRSRIVDIAVSFFPYILLAPFRGLGNVLVFKKIQAKLGGRFVAGISGGGALPAAVDRFFSAAGILLLEGYGLTETAPVLGVRKQNHPVPGTVGPVFPGTEIKIVDEDFKELPPGTKGRVLAKGPQVMKGYYKKPEETAKIMKEDGFLDTGDLGKLTWNNELKILGRVKDTIVLLGGENVEPTPIEEKLKESEYIDQAILLGQDQKFLAALIVPDNESVESWAKQNNISYIDFDQLLQSPEVHDLFGTIIHESVSGKTGFKSFERVYRFKLINADFQVGKELSGKQEVKRHVIADQYSKEIRELFK
ncbi:MAG: AMP-dependent synthetase/ligase [Spirochaetia bacterium]